MYTTFHAATIVAALFAASTAAAALGQCRDGVCFPPLMPTRPSNSNTSTKPTPPLPAIVRVGSIADNVTDYGSGAIIARNDGRAYVVTCSHIFTDNGSRGRPRVDLADGRQYWARLLHNDRTYDVALLEIQDPQIEPLEIADTPPAVGDKLTATGYGNGTFRALPGIADGYVQPNPTAAYDCLRITGQARNGDSGGPMLSTHLRIVAVTWGTRDNKTYGTCCTRLRLILRALLPPYRPPITRTQPRPLPIQPPTNSQTAPQQPEPTTPTATTAPPTPTAAEITAIHQDLGRLHAQLAQPITIQVIDQNGNIAQTTETRLGGYLRLQLVPVQPK